MVIGLGKEIPLKIYEYIRPFSAELCDRSERGVYVPELDQDVDDLNEVEFSEAAWALHPGGPMYCIFIFNPSFFFFFFNVLLIGLRNIN